MCDVNYSIREGANFDFVGNLWGDNEHQIEWGNQKIKEFNLRPGFRDFVDVIYPNESGIHNAAESVFFNTPEFIAYRSKLLKEKYENIDTLKKSWQTEGDFVTSFDEAAKLIPVYSGNYIYLMDKDYTDKIYKLNKNTDFWYEYLELTYKSYGDIRNNLMTRIKEKCDVPILTKMVLFSKPYNSNMAKDRTGMDGSGYELYSIGDNLMDYGAGFRYGEMEAGNKAVFAATTEINRTASEHCYPNYPDIQAYFYDISVVLLMLKIMKKNILGIETATFDNYIYKEVGYTIKGQPVSVLHTTKKKMIKF